jgi:hypothetical protein
MFGRGAEVERRCAHVGHIRANLLRAQDAKEIKRQEQQNAGGKATVLIKERKDAAYSAADG